jgi:SAM-dependent methyltransferase
MMPESSGELSQASSQMPDVSQSLPAASPQIAAAPAPERKMAAERAMLGLLYDLRKFHSVVDFGCGLGIWLNVARELGATETRGYDNAEFLAAARGFAKTDIFAADLTRFIEMEKRFDLAICLETADRLGADAAVPLVRTLCAAADWVLFGAAPPFQQVGQRRNEKWLEYWAELFLNNGFLCYDILRPGLWHHRDIAFYLRQNACLYVRKGAQEALRSRGIAASASPASMIHPELFLKLMSWLVNREASGTDSRAFAEDLANLYEGPWPAPEAKPEIPPVVAGDAP